MPRHSSTWQPIYTLVRSSYPRNYSPTDFNPVPLVNISLPFYGELGSVSNANYPPCEENRVSSPDPPSGKESRPRVEGYQSFFKARISSTRELLAIELFVFLGYHGRPRFVLRLGTVVSLQRQG